MTKTVGRCQVAMGYNSGSQARVRGLRFDGSQNDQSIHRNILLMSSPVKT